MEETEWKYQLYKYFLWSVLNAVEGAKFMTGGMLLLTYIDFKYLNVWLLLAEALLLMK